MPIDEEEFERLQAERDRYKQLAQGQLANDAIGKAFDAARGVAIQALKHLPDDEREALEAHLGKSIDEALKDGLRLTWAGGTEAMMLQLPKKDDEDDSEE